jgi:hypothetical protein
VYTFDHCGSWLASDVSAFNTDKPAYSRTYPGLTINNRQLSLPVLFIAGWSMPFFTVDGQALHYIDQGTGPAVLLAGSYLWDTAMWAPQIAALSRTTG